MPLHKPSRCMFNSENYTVYVDVTSGTMYLDLYEAPLHHINEVIDLLQEVQNHLEGIPG